MIEGLIKALIDFDGDQEEHSVLGFDLEDKANPQKM
jgi:hypothetical protein